jgi:anti-anti-sigma regulatory factor
MLKITRTTTGGRATIKLEGEISDAWIDEARRACQRNGDAAVALDLGEVTFVDAAGRELLVELLCQGAKLAACSNFVAELLHVEKP